MDSRLLPDSSANSVDLDELLDRCLGRLDVVEKVLGRFQDAIGHELEQLELALRAADCGEIARLAHRIKGTALTVSARGLHDCAKRLESSAATKQLREIEDGVAVLKQECARLADRLPLTS